MASNAINDGWSVRCEPANPGANPGCTSAASAPSPPHTLAAGKNLSPPPSIGRDGLGEREVGSRVERAVVVGRIVGEASHRAPSGAPSEQVLEVGGARLAAGADDEFEVEGSERGHHRAQLDGRLVSLKAGDGALAQVDMVAECALGQAGLFARRVSV